MKKIKMASLIALFISIIGTGFNSSAQDKVTLNNTSGNEIGLLVDGNFNGPFVNDKTFLSVISPVTIGNFTKATGSKTNEVMAFTTDRPMEVYTPAPWTKGNDNINISFSNKILIPLTVWILYGDFDSARTKITNDLLTTSSIFNNEKVGIDFSTITFMDARANPLTPNHVIFNYNGSSSISSLKTDIGHVSGQINVYHTYAVNYGGTIYTNFGIGYPDLIVLGSLAVNSVLTHELGHSFSLAHVSNGYVYPADFDKSNVMGQQAGPWVLYFTEGQIARIHTTPGSAINSIYNARPGKVQRNCGTYTCPTLSKRIWADGAFSPNATQIIVQSRSSNTKQLAMNWLNLNCFDDDEGKNEREIILQHTELAPYFINVIENGLEPEVLQEVKEVAGQLYDQNIKLLNENKPEWVTKEYENKIKSISREQFIANEIETVTSNYTSQAIKGLAILNQSKQSEEFYNGMKLTAYPNPVVNEKITIEYTLEKNSSNVCIFIFNQTGQRLIAKQYHEQSAGTYKVNIETDQFAPGTYFYQLNGDGHSFTKKFVVSR